MYNLISITKLQKVHYIETNFHLATQAVFNYEIISFDFGYSEIGDKFGPLHESVFTGDERCKLKYNATQSKLLLRLLPYLLSSFVDQPSAYYMFLIQNIEVFQIMFSPVISKGTVTALECQIEEHL